ncbi:MAG: hypothetical protein JRH12_00295 [Deltaproteobacteria bacterium]|nr:hypothetical protein [Deltaproteobacteria bacterium]MBW2481275.1 hypothetical protein [Deltaproteobacteria bacterium]
MGVLPLLEKNSKQRICLGNQDLPANYMEDYSVMGLVVGRVETALRILKDKKFDLRQNADGFEIAFDGAGQITELVNLLQQNRIDCTLADIADQVYQG